MKKKLKELAVLEPVEPLIREIRGERVMLDSDLARIYGVPTKRLNEQVRRNAKRFPADFVFQLTPEELDSMRSQFATASNTARPSGRKMRPHQNAMCVFFRTFSPNTARSWRRMFSAVGARWR